METSTAKPATGELPNNRRAHARHTPEFRAAVWFNTGVSIGETCELVDVSLSGFGIRCNEWQLPVFLGTGGHSIYCVLLLGEAHFGCMAHLVGTSKISSGQLGFFFDAVPVGDIRLLEGLIDCMANRDEALRLQAEHPQDFESI